MVDGLSDYTIIYLVNCIWNVWTLIPPTDHRPLKTMSFRRMNGLEVLKMALGGCDTNIVTQAS